MSDLHARGLFNGAVVLGRDGEILYENAWGPANVEAGVPFTPDTPVDGASLCKTFIAAAVWMLVDEGKLDLDAPVQRYLPEYPHAVTTVRNLIEFSSGLPDLDEFQNMLSTEALTAERMLDAIRERGTLPAFDPGSIYEYSSLGFEVAALVVERISGLEFEAFLQQRVFQPLGMDSSFARPARLSDWRGIRTLSYRQVNGVLTLYDVWDNDGTYGLYFSARDFSGGLPRSTRGRC